MIVIASPSSGATALSGGATTVDCQKQVRSWRLLRSLVELLIPSCNCTFLEENEYKQENCTHKYYYYRQPSFTSTSFTITGTIFGYRRGKVSLCIQKSPKSMEPILLLQLAIPTANLAREMGGGLLRIVLECNTVRNDRHGSSIDRSCSLLSMPVWNMYCNGRKAGGFAVKRQPSRTDLEVLKRTESIVVGAGVIEGKELGGEDDVMYLRGEFRRVYGSCDSESFHLIDPDGNIGQELSVFFIRSC